MAFSAEVVMRLAAESDCAPQDEMSASFSGPVEAVADTAALKDLPPELKGGLRICIRVKYLSGTVVQVLAVSSLRVATSGALCTFGGPLHARRTHSRPGLGIRSGIGSMSSLHDPPFDTGRTWTRIQRSQSAWDSVKFLFRFPICWISYRIQGFCPNDSH